MDITVAWTPSTCTGDWVLADGDLQAGDDLETAVLLSLFTDRVAAAGYVAPGGSTDPHGWWGDTDEASPIGSRFWQLRRRTKIGSTALLTEAQGMAVEALQWMLDAGIVATVTTAAVWRNRTTLALSITLAMPDGTARTFKYAWAWSAV